MSVSARYNQLIAERETLESEILQLLDALKSNNSNMSDPLVDAEGFPRSDIDVYTVRQLRHSIILKQNDHKGLMAKIEDEMHRVFAERKQADVPQQHVSIEQKPFAIVAAVAASSPAEECGLTAGDGIVRFGSAVELSGVPSEVVEGGTVNVLVEDFSDSDG
ncbi:hypothetical protein HDU82_000307 [Entophlyctis luteolus]|nr:hypothetical protein HDU82_000307 [Entophlyctis luteolus]